MIEKNVNRLCPVCDNSIGEEIKGIKIKTLDDSSLPEEYSLVQCNKCDFLYADTSATLQDYETYYANSNIYGTMILLDEKIRLKKCLEFFQKYIDKNESILDIGCGQGVFLKILKDNGYTNLMGIDPSAEAIRELEKYGISGRVKSIFEKVPESMRHNHDVVIFTGVIEHLLLPKEGIMKASDYLNRTGKIFIEVPDIETINQQDTLIADNFNLEHINYFSRVSLKNLMRLCGFCKISEDSERNFQISTSNPKIDMAYFFIEVKNIPMQIERDSSTINEIRQYLIKAEKNEIKIKNKINGLLDSSEEIAIWGTGNYAGYLLANSSLNACNIRFFLDSNPIKHGKKLLGREIKHIDALKDFDGTIVICSMFSGWEIENKLLENGIRNKILTL